MLVFSLYLNVVMIEQASSPAVVKNISLVMLPSLFQEQVK